MTGPDVAGEGVDGRSVGELLLDADLAARACLWDPDPATAKARVRTWCELAKAATDVWAAIPDRTGAPSMGRIHELTQGLHRTHRRTQWPGSGPGDPHLESITTTLARAAELVAARRHPTAALSEAAHHDAEAARTRIMLILYVSAHGVGTALNRHMGDLQQRLGSRLTLPAGDSLRHARDTRTRIGAVEALAGSYLRDRWPSALAGEHKDPAPTTRLEQALTRWDLQAHRTLAHPPTAGNLDRIARVQAEIAVATSIIGAAAASRGLPDPHSDRRRLALTGLEHAWGQLGAAFEPMIGRQLRFDPELRLAGNEVRAALRDITHDHARLADPATIADRADHPAVMASLHRGLTAGVDLAHVVRDALADPELAVAARGAHAMATTTGAPQTLAAWVEAGDLHHNRQVTLPPPVRTTLIGHAEQIIAAAAAADSAAVAHPPSRYLTRVDSTRTGRQHQERTPPPTGPENPPAPGFKCER